MNPHEYNIVINPYEGKSTPLQFDPHPYIVMGETKYIVIHAFLNYRPHAFFLLITMFMHVRYMHELLFRSFVFF